VLRPLSALLLYLSLLLLLFNLTEKGAFFPVGSGTTIRHSTQIHINTKLQHNTAHKATQTIKDTLHTMSTTQK
jgi:hypothetical protein